ncbi:MAG: UDP-3-O-(3-hydroxymyristoyl)glucosamine N-acyltransferase [Bacteroidetes bacterium]|nr:UDP-3-O-(3-hydroxymyristoyl)glucosamine N-acyltransferase [Bacteroidota bacterium]MBU1114110.1 UDP-3-O-(3-hydroxymyristoyl)glucosamine N-acyltransferase [Bacteroidota bacterium]MBU1800183.1 UDP-3-O-(3-hydroxymyristoyl)glucosamine N-acyltransferase [Bacteroidota bacterium]
MKITIKEIAEFVGGKIIGDENIEIENVSKIYEANQNDLTFLYLPNYVKYLLTTKASVVLINSTIEKSRTDITYIEVQNPDVALHKVIIKYFNTKKHFVGIDETSSIHPSAIIGKNVSIGKNVVISENCSIGNDSVIYHNSVILENTTLGTNCLIYPNVTITYGNIIGNNVIIHSGTVVGSDGFGYFPNEKGKFTKVPQIGNVVLEDYVELGSNVSIDRAALGSTIIKEGTKIDNLVQIAHNVEVGKHTAISGQSGIAGSSKVGDHCIFGGQVAISGHIEIGNQIMIGGKSAASKSILTPGKYFGIPAKEVRIAFKEQAHIRNLDKYSTQIKELEKKVTELENRINKNTGNS